MGGRGARFGRSDYGDGKPYGSQYAAIKDDNGKRLSVNGNVLFVTKTSRQSETLMETMTKGRVYAVVGGDEVKEIIYFGSDNKRVKSINLNHTHGYKGKNGRKEYFAYHTHHGYKHNENDSLRKGASNLTPEEKKMVDTVLEAWYKYRRK